MSAENPALFPLSSSPVELVLFEALAAEVGRKAAAAAFLAAKGVTKKALAERLGTHFTRQSQVFALEALPEETIQKYEGLGIPRFLLPRPSRRAA